jgi:hypothetical protein
MLRAPATESCFGKETEFDPESTSCSLYCHDSKICEQTIEEEKMKNATAKTKTSELDDVDFSQIETKKTKKAATVKKAATKKAPAPVATKKVAAKAAAPKVKAKPATTKKDDDAPADVVKWPFKQGSMMRMVFKLAYDGISATDLEKAVTKKGNSVKIAMIVLRSGLAGCGAINGTAEPTHKWRLSEEDGFLKLTNLKYVGGKVVEKTDKKAAKAAKAAKAPKAGKAVAAAAAASTDTEAAEATA